MISQRPPGECEAIVRTMTRCMEHEAFYVSGIHTVPEMCIYGGWAGLENSPDPAQIFFNEQRDIALLFCGECFIDQQTRTGLRRRGHNFGKQAGDWLVHLYEEEGDGFFERLNGLFSGLLIDKKKSRAFLFNDRYGMERIYWCETRHALYFASEAKALLRILPELRAFDEEGLAQFLAFGCTLEWRTLFRGVSLLPGASLWSFEKGIHRKKRYFSPAAWESRPTLSGECFESQFQETFQEILPRYFESDGRIGISLTGGLDTRMIMAGRPETGEKPICYTFAGENGETIDARLAARVAATCGLDHRILRIGPDFFSNFASHADRTVYITDGCFGVQGAHEIYLHRRARELAPVRLTGNFGSEVLRSMSTFKPLGLSPELFSPEFGQAVQRSTSGLCCTHEHPVTFGAFREIPWNLFGSLAAGRSQVTFRTPYLDNEIVALAFQAPGNFRTTPLQALRFVKNNSIPLSNIPTDRGLTGANPGLIGGLRHFLSEAAFKFEYHTNEGLPHCLSPLDQFFKMINPGARLLGSHKYLHYRSWFRAELAAHMSGIFADARIRRMSFWNSGFIEHMAADHICGRKNYIREINAVLTIEAVERLLFQGLPRGLEFSGAAGAASISPTATREFQLAQPALAGGTMTTKSA